MLGDFADVQEAVGAGEKFDEGAKFGEAHDFAKIRFANFGAGGDVADHLQGRIAAGAAGREDVHSAVFEDVDLDARGLDDGLDLLAARTDEVPNLGLRDLQLEEARGVGRNRGTLLAERCFHGIEDLEARFFGLRQGFAHHGDANAKNLDVHLERGDSRARPGDFEIHVAVVVFGASDVREDRKLVVFADDETHGDARARSLHRNAGVHKRQRAAAYSGHRGRTVRFQDVGDEAHGVGEIRFGWKQIHEGALSQSAVADFATAGAAEEFYFADAERREVVVQHKAVELILLEKQVEALHVFLGAKRPRCKRLRLAVGEERRAGDAREQANFARDGANLGGKAAIGTAALVENVVAEDVFTETLGTTHGEITLLFAFLRDRFPD